MADLYSSYAQLAAARNLGIDYDVLNQNGSGDYVLHIAIHGGGIEPPTLQLAQAATGTGGPFYGFNAKMASGNSQLHISALTFDEPLCLYNVAHSLRTVSWHGVPDQTTGQQAVYLSGLDLGLLTSVGSTLKAAGYTVLPGYGEVDGANPANICNRNRIGAGLQLGLTNALRTTFYTGGDLSLGSISNPANRTAAFFKFVDTVRAGIAAAPSVAAPVAQPANSYAPSTMPQIPAGSTVAVALPFDVDQTGAIQVTTDPSQQMLDRVQALVGTLPGQRVMRATYGVPTSQFLFMPEDMANAALQLAVKDAVATWEPSAVVTAVTGTVNEAMGVVNVQVQVARTDTPSAESANTRVVEVAVGGQVSPIGV